MKQVQIQNPNPWWWQRRFFLRQLPTAWRDISPKLRFWCIQQLMGAGGDTLAVKVKCLIKILDLPLSVWRKLTDEQLSALVDALDFMVLKSHAIPIIDFFDHQTVRYYLPKAGFSNASAIEFPIADAFLNAFVETGDKKYLRLLTATLCREAIVDPLSIEGADDCRRPLKSKAEAEIRCLQLEGVSDDILTIVMLYFVGCKLDIADTYSQYLFQNEGDDTENDTPDSEINFGWWGIFDSVARSGVFGDYEAVKQTNFLNLCNHLVINALEQKRLSKLLKSPTPIQ